MLILLNDPAGVTGVRRLPLDLSISLHANIERHLEAGGDCELRINGMPVDPMTDPRLDMPPRAGDWVAVARRPAGLDPVSGWVIAAIAVGATAVIYSLIPNLPGNESAQKDSPNNRLTGQTNLARAYQAVPDVYGYRRVWPDLIQPSTVEYIDHVKFVTEWMCISRGKGDVTDVRYADTPIGDIEGASFEVFAPAASPDSYPERNATTLTDIVEAFDSPDVNGQELAYEAAPPPVYLAYANFTAGSGSTFSITTPDGARFQAIKDNVPVSAVVNINQYIASEGGVDDYSWSGAVTIDSFSVSSGQITLVMTAAAPTPIYGAALNEVVINPTLPAGAVTVGSFTLSISDATIIRWNTAFLRGLRGTVNIRAEWWKIDGAGSEVSGTRQTADFSFVADTLDQRFYTREVTPAAGPGRYKIQFQRLNPESGDGDDIAKLEEVYAIRKYPTKVLPGVTVIRVTTRATEQATGFSDRKFNVRWQRHVRTLTSNTLSASRNFARSMAHVWTIAGKPIGELDTDALAAINTALGEPSALLRFDGSLDDADMSLGERLQLIANHARCSVWRDGTKWTVTREERRSVPEIQLDYRNLDARGESSIGYAAHLPASNDGIELTYVDEADQAKKTYVRLNVSSGAVVDGVSGNPKKISLLGCTTLAQATNRAQLEARRLLYERTTVTDTALGDAGQLGLGALVRWVDPHDFAGDADLQAGEVLAIEGTTIQTSEPLHWQDGTSGRILFTGVDGLPIAAPVLCTPGATDTEVILASAPAGLFVADADRQCGSRYAFAAGLTEAEMEAAALFVVRSARPAANGSVSLTMTSYDDRMFDYDD